MPIARKPQHTASELDVEALISRGGSVAAAGTAETEPPPPRATTVVNLRIPTSLIERLDRALETRPLRKPRHAWLLEAVLEKLEREAAE